MCFWVLIAEARLWGFPLGFLTDIYLKLLLSFGINVVLGL
jgi:hypothetical protein